MREAYTEWLTCMLRFDHQLQNPNSSLGRSRRYRNIGAWNFSGGWTLNFLLGSIQALNGMNGLIYCMLKINETVDEEGWTYLQGVGRLSWKWFGTKLNLAVRR